MPDPTDDALVEGLARAIFTDGFGMSKGSWRLNDARSSRVAAAVCARTALAYLRERGMLVEWRLIETAPKDCELLVCGPLKDGSGTYREVQRWWPGLHARWPVEWMDNCLPPTHWMPLAAAPKP